MFGVDVGTTKGKVALAFGSVVGVFGVYLVARQRNKNVKSMSKKKLLNIFADLERDMQRSVMECGQQEKQIRGNAAQMGQKVSDVEIYQYINQELSKTMALKEAQIYAKYKVTEAQAKKASKKYAKDELVVRQIGRLQKLADLVAPPKPTTLPAWLTEDKLIEIMTELMEKVTSMMEAFVAKLAENGVTAEAAPQRFQQTVAMQLNQNMQLTQKYIQDKYKITQAVMSTALNEYGDSPKVNQALQAMSVSQKERFTALGVGAMV